MFSTSMIASSTTTPIATTNPASTITFTVSPRMSRMSSAPSRDNGIAIRLMKAVRHSKRKATMIRTTSRIPISMAMVRLSIDCSMKVAGRKIVVSTLMPGRPACSSLIAASTPRVTSSVLAPRNFWTTSMMPGPSLMTASPIRGPWSMATSPMSASRRTFPSRSTTGTAPSSEGSVIGCTWRILKRRTSSSMKPPVPTTAPSEYLRRPASTASAAASITWARETSCSASFAGST